ncbi:MAG: tetratricopeptide repeat protein [Bacteroidetes bacterium]|nr:MAG: tetratricopeptide repeat protein [Bacteroidota bacterium]
MRRFVLLLFACLILTPALFAQGPEELEHLTFEVDNLLSKAQAEGSDARMYDLANQSLAIARDLRYDGGIVRASILLGQVCARTNRPEEALQHFLEAEKKLNPGGVSTPLVLNKQALREVYTGLGDLFFQEKLYKNAGRYYQLALDLSPEDYTTMEKAADACLLNMQYDSAEVIYKVLIQHYKYNRTYPKLVKIYQKLANAYGEYGEAGKGLFYYLRIEDIIEYNGYPEERAVMYNNMGKQYAALNDYAKALEYFRKAELQCEYINCDYIELVYANIGIALHNTGDSQQGVSYLLRALQLLKEQKDLKSMASLEHLIAGVYFNNQDVYNALSHNNEAIRLAEETKQNDVLANCYRTSADIYYQLYDFEKAFEAYQQHLLLNDSIRLQEQARQQRIDQQRAMLTAAEGEIKYLITLQDMKDLELQQIRFEQDRLKLLNKNLELEKKNREDEVKLLQSQKEADQANLREQTLRALQADQQLRLAAQQLDAEKQERLIASLRQQEQIDRAQRQADSIRVRQLRKDQEFQQSKQDSFRRFVYTMGGLGMVILILLGLGWWLTRRSRQRLELKNRKIEAQKAQIEEERQKSDRLLLNILPDEVAQELRSHGYATPRFYEAATVLFTDFSNFTRLSESLTPEELIDELNACFLGFDEICDKYGLEKIKTIGDAYMCAGGLPVPNDTHPEDAVNAALEMLAWLRRRHEAEPDAVFNNMRIGIHTGPVIAGVIGKNKFAYDIWGDAVNLASRLEELGEPGRINISGATYAVVKDRFNCSYRGKKEVHNKGLVDMYFIDEQQG